MRRALFTGPRFPLLLIAGRTGNSRWHEEDRLEIISRAALRALIADSVAPGVVRTAFHHPS